MFPTLIDLGPIHIATYGVLVAAGYLAGILWLKARREKLGLSEDKFWSLVYATFFGAVLGGKLMFVLLNWPEFWNGRIGLIRDFRYGFVFYGGVLGAFACGAIFARREGIPIARTADYFGVALPIGHAIGRLGCLAAGCCYGRPTRLPWGIAFHRADSLVPDRLLGVPLHPTQLYEAIGNLAVAALVYRKLEQVEAGRASHGRAFAAYAVYYAVLRFAVEAFRGDDRGGFLAGLSPAQWTAIAFVAVGVWFLVAGARRAVRS